MKEYKPSVHDVVFVNKEDMNENIKELGLEVNKEYLVTYLFADGGCILYEEEVHISGYVEASEYILEKEDVESLSFIYNYMDDSLNKYEKMNEDSLVYLEDGSTADITYDTWVDHYLKVGDYVYFENVELVKFYNEADLKNNERYEIKGFSEHNNAPIIDSPIGEFELYPIEVMYLSLDEDINGDETFGNMIIDMMNNNYNKSKGAIKTDKKERNTTNVSQKESKSISEMLDNLAFDMAMNKALENENYDVAQLISDDNEYYKAIAKNSEN